MADKRVAAYSGKESGGETFAYFWTSLIIGAFLDGLAIWATQRYALHLSFTYWQCFWVAACVVYVGRTIKL